MVIFFSFVFADKILFAELFFFTKFSFSVDLNKNLAFHIYKYNIFTCKIAKFLKG